MTPDAAQFETAFARGPRRTGPPSLRAIVAWLLLAIGASTLIGWALALNLAVHAAARGLGL